VRTKGRLEYIEDITEHIEDITEYIYDISEDIEDISEDIEDTTEYRQPHRLMIGCTGDEFWRIFSRRALRRVRNYK